MGLPDFSIKKPVTSVMLFLGVAIFGIISLVKLPLELFPPIEYPQLTVFTEYANAAPQEIETLLTKPVEEALGTVAGVRAIRSISKEGVSLVFAEFGWDQNMDFASLKVREKVDLIKARLPRDASEPLVVPFNPFEMPVMQLSVTGVRRSPVELRRIAVEIIKAELEKLEGVASASVEGGLEREIIIEVNQAKLLDYNVPILDVSDAITNSNLNYPAGTIKESFYEYLIRTIGEFESIEEIREVAVKSEAEETQQQLPFDEQLRSRDISHNPNIVFVNDVAEVKDSVKERTSFSRYNGNENVSISIQKQAQANTVQVVDRVKGSFGKIKKRLPPDIEMNIVYDQSTYIKDAILGVTDSAWQGGILTLLVLVAFLRDFMASMIVTMSIPLSVVVVFTFMYFGGLSINMMSFGGLALGVGMLVDNAIVVVENIFRHRELGESPEEAAVKGANEVVGAITASTLTTIAVFLPMIFVIGIAGQLF
jgi:HAE1 family hydrophobic/amphiphilic exporter-1